MNVLPVRPATVWIALLLMASAAGPVPGQGPPEADPDGETDRRSSVVSQVRQIIEDCRPVPRLKAAGGGGLQELRAGEEIRIPYGVPYHFFHRVVDADFVLLRLDVTDGPGTVVEAVRVRGDSTCFTAGLPALPMNRGITLVESQGLRPSTTERTAMIQALETLRAEFLTRLFGNAYDQAIGQGRLRSAAAEDFGALVDTAVFSGFAIRDTGAPGGTRPLLDVVRAGFLENVGLISRTPHDISRARGLIDVIVAIRDSRGSCIGANLTPDQQQRVIGLLDRVSPLRTVLPEDYPRHYAAGTLPLDPALLEGFAAAVRAACPSLPDQQLRELTEIAVALTRNEIAPVLEAIRAAARLVEESYRITVVDGFGGATTTLQRFGQMDVVNAYFLGRDEARLLATFNFYPLALRFGGEIRPHDGADRLLASVGYSFATPVATDDVDAGDEGPPTAFTAGLSYRINELFALGGGAWFIGGDRDWYVSLSGDLGAVPALRELFARLPDR